MLMRWPRAGRVGQLFILALLPLYALGIYSTFTRSAWLGLALGLMGALWLGRAWSSLLFGVNSADPLTFTTVSLLLMAVAAAACYFPARRAMKVEPIVALRQE